MRLVVVGVLVEPALTLTVYDCVVELVPLVTRTPKDEVPAAVGLPLIVAVLPVDAASVNPAGSAPVETLQVKVPVAVVLAVSVWL